MLGISIILFFMDIVGQIYAECERIKYLMFIQQNLLNIFYAYHFMIQESWKV